MAEDKEFPYYTVRCTLHVAREMTRIEGSELLQCTQPECRYTSPSLVADHTTYVCVIRGKPNYELWRSLGEHSPSPCTEVGRRFIIAAHNDLYRHK